MATEAEVREKKEKWKTEKDQCKNLKNSVVSAEKIVNKFNFEKIANMFDKAYKSDVAKKMKQEIEKDGEVYHQIAKAMGTVISNINNRIVTLKNAINEAEHSLQNPIIHRDENGNEMWREYTMPSIKTTSYDSIPLPDVSGKTTKNKTASKVNNDNDGDESYADGVAGKKVATTTGIKGGTTSKSKGGKKSEAKNETTTETKGGKKSEAKNETTTEAKGGKKSETKKETATGIKGKKEPHGINWNESKTTAEGKNPKTVLPEGTKSYSLNTEEGGDLKYYYNEKTGKVYTKETNKKGETVYEVYGRNATYKDGKLHLTNEDGNRLHVPVVPTPKRIKELPDDYIICHSGAHVPLYYSQETRKVYTKETNKKGETVYEVFGKNATFENGKLKFTDNEDGRYNVGINSINNVPKNTTEYVDLTDGSTFYLDKSTGTAYYLKETSKNGKDTYKVVKNPTIGASVVEATAVKEVSKDKIPNAREITNEDRGGIKGYDDGKYEYYKGKNGNYYRVKANTTPGLEVLGGTDVVTVDKLPSDKKEATGANGLQCWTSKETGKTYYIGTDENGKIVYQEVDTPKVKE